MSDLSIERAAELCVILAEDSNSKYKGPHRKERVQFWKEAIEAARAGSLTFIADGLGKTDGLCGVCDNPDKRKCFRKK